MRGGSNSGVSVSVGDPHFETFLDLVSQILLSVKSQGTKGTITYKNRTPA